MLMALNAMLFVVIFLAVAFNYRLAADDFHYLVKSKDLGVWNSMLFYYHNWNPRWSATLVTCTFLGAYSSPITLFLFHLSSLVLGGISIFSFLHGIVKHLSLPFTRLQLVLFSFYLLGALFYGAFSKNDSWFWFTVAPMYLWGSFAAVLGGSLILHQWNKGMRYLLIGLLFLYAGGASETIAIATLAVLFYLGFITHGERAGFAIDRTALHMATISCFIGFGIDISGAGAVVRYQHLPHSSFTDKAVIAFWNYLKFTFKEIPITLPWIILFVSPLTYFGRKQLRFQITALKEIFWRNRKFFGITDILIVLLSVVLAFVMGEMGPKRAWIPLTFIVVTAALVIAYQLGTWLYIKTNGKLFYLVIGAQLLLLVGQVWSGFHQVRTTRTYAYAVDARMHTLENEVKNGNTFIELEPLPAPGWLFTSEITIDTTHFRNKHLSLYLSGDQKVVLKQTATFPSE